MPAFLKLPKVLTARASEPTINAIAPYVWKWYGRSIQALSALLHYNGRAVGDYSVRLVCVRSVPTVQPARMGARDLGCVLGAVNSGTQFGY
jgi:hypothetical protein